MHYSSTHNAKPSDPTWTKISTRKTFICVPAIVHSLSYIPKKSLNANKYKTIYNTFIETIYIYTIKYI